MIDVVYTSNSNDYLHILVCSNIYVLEYIEDILLTHPGGTTKMTVLIKRFQLKFTMVVYDKMIFQMIEDICLQKTMTQLYFINEEIQTTFYFFRYN